MTVMHFKHNQWRFNIDEVGVGGELINKHKSGFSIMR